MFVFVYPVNLLQGTVPVVWIGDNVLFWPQLVLANLAFSPYVIVAEGSKVPGSHLESVAVVCCGQCPTFENHKCTHATPCVSHCASVADALTEGASRIVREVSASLAQVPEVRLLETVVFLTAFVVEGCAACYN